jgi:hypothetical protein
MEHLSAGYISRAETWMTITTLLYFFMNGAQIFETVVIIPRWTANPPQSLQMFKGKYGLDFKWFWIVMHSVHEITFILALIFCWNLGIRNWLLFLFIVHFAARVWTLLYFAPGIISFQKMANENTIGTDLLQAIRWRRLNYLRVTAFIAVSLGLIPLCMALMQ